MEVQIIEVLVQITFKSMKTYAFRSFELDVFNKSGEQVHKTGLDDSTKSRTRQSSIVNILEIPFCPSSLFKKCLIK